MNNRMRSASLALAAPLASLLLAFLLSALVLVLVGSNPLVAFGDMLEYGSRLEIVIDMLNRATPLYLSGIAAAIGFRMNLFNIGVEGQYQLAMFVAAVVGGALALPGFLHLLLILVVAMIVGGLWSGLAGLLKVTRGVNEVIGTIMLNFIAIGGIIAALIGRFRDGEISTNSGTKLIAESGWMPNLNGFVEAFTRDIKGRQLSGMLVVAVLVGIAYHLTINRSRFGFDLRASGLNPMAARSGGVPPKRMVVVAMVLSGAAAGLVGMVDLVSRYHRYDNNFSPGLGFAGIAVALLGRHHPVGVAFAALLFAFMDSSSSILQVTGSASPEIVIIMQGVILLTAVITYEYVNQIRQREETKMAALATAGGAA